jgi:peptidoglycan/LPS O-acetylase OafA/YrhL
VTPDPLGYQPALDGMRALAIGVVMAGHAIGPNFSGGGLGVDVFFALSGFLISTLVLEELRDSRTDDFGFVRFYARRALRLLPALYTMLAAVTLYYFVASPADRVGLLGTIAASSFYVNDLSFAWGVPASLISHTWSLAVEEQFYLVWPAIVVTFVRRSALRVLFGMLAVFVVLALLGRLDTRLDPFSILGERPDAIVVGCLLALARWLQPGRFRAVFSRVGVGVAGLVGVLVIMVGDAHWLPESMLTSGAIILVAVSTSVLIGHLVSSTSVIGRAFSLKPFTQIGRISYGLYIWHYPIFLLVERHTSLTGLAAALVEVPLAFGAALASWFLVERRALRLKRRFEPETRGREARVWPVELADG